MFTIQKKIKLRTGSNDDRQTEREEKQREDTRLMKNSNE